MLLVDMGFNLNLRARVSPRAMIIVNLYLIALFLEATAANDTSCCARTDIPLTVECTNDTAQLKWGSMASSFGFSVRYGCNSTAECDGGEELRFRKRELTNNGVDDRFALNITNASFINVTCWFLVRPNKISDDPSCSKFVECTEVQHNDTVSSVNTSDLVSLSTPSSTILTSFFISPSFVSSATIITGSVITTIITTTTTTTIATATIATATTVANATTTTTTTITTTTDKTIPTLSPTTVISTTNDLHASLAPQQNIFPSLYSLLLYVTLCCTVIFILLLLTVCLFVYWRKRKRKQFETFVKGQIEDVCCEYTGDVEKESDSEIETVINGNGIEDEISITDDDMHIMLRKILHSDDMSLDLSIFTHNEADDGSVTLSHYRIDNDSVDCSHYCGSGGHSLDSNTNINHHRNSSCSSVC